ncbi:MAG: hypothetical protein HYY24_21570 [Verrucomicrobia bacterium]|nr:hypothetical protein [Verrucomicrobiota bacterium]
MSTAEILAELPKLSPQQRSAVARRLQELEEEDGLLFLHEAAVQMFQEMDREEANDADRKAG